MTPRVIKPIKLQKITETFSPYVRGHGVRTSLYCQILYNEILRSDDQLEQRLHMAPPPILYIREGGFYHDIGKVSLPMQVQEKRKLTADEEAVLATQHCVEAQTILQEFLANASPADQLYYRIMLDMATTHHEYWDGTGHPNGLKGEEIPFWGRLCAVANRYEQLTFKRYYGLEKTHMLAIEELNNASGTMFDPYMVKAFLRCETNFAKMLKDGTLPLHGKRDE